MIVLDDADVETAAAGRRPRLLHQRRPAVHLHRAAVRRTSDLRRVRRALRRRARTCGSALDYDADMGSLTSQRQLDTVTRHVDDAVAKGAKVLAGGRPARTSARTSSSRPCSTGVTEDDGAVPRARRSARSSRSTGSSPTTRRSSSPTTREYGLNASVWTGTLARGRRLAARVRSGTVNVNEGYASAYGLATTRRWAA